MNAFLSPPTALPAPTRTLELLYLYHFLLITSHELGQNFGLDLCVYYSCMIIGVASLEEDARGTPYLYPVCEGTVGAARIESKG